MSLFSFEKILKILQIILTILQSALKVIHVPVDEEGLDVVDDVDD